MARELASKNGKMMSELPEELLCDILSRIPPEHLFELRRVCKSWNDIISSIYFANEQVRRANRQPGLIVRFKGTQKGFHQLSFDFDGHNFGKISRCLELKYPESDDETIFSSVLASCNGLLLVGCGDHLVEPTLTTRDHLIICNPITGSITKLFPPPTTQDLWLQHHSTFADMFFDFGRWFTLFHWSLVYDDSVKRYKVIAMEMYDSDNINKDVLFGWEVGCSSTWREIPLSNLSIECLMRCMRPRFANGKLHFLETKKGLLYSMDIVTERFYQTLGPPILPYASVTSLIEMNGDLYYVSVGAREETSTPSMEIWVMKNWDKMVWTKHLVTSSNIDVFLRPFKQTYIIGLFLVESRCNGGGKTYLISRDWKNLFYYELQSGEVRRIDVLEDLEFHMLTCLNFKPIFHANALVNPLKTMQC